MEWTKEQVIRRLKEIEKKGFIPVPDGMYRNDDGIVGQKQYLNFISSDFDRRDDTNSNI